MLDTENVTNYHNGQYLAWLMSGHVEIRVTGTAGANGVTSGLFFDPTGPVPVSVSVSPPSATLTTNGQQQFTATVTGSSNTAVTWSMSPSAGTLTASGLYTAPGTISASQAITITATSVADPTKSAAATVTLNPGGTTTTGTATFVTLDTATQGNWKSVYGADGYNVINNTVAYPGYVTVTPSGVNAYTWAASTSDVRALSKASSSTDRIAATWYNSSPFLIDLAFNDTAQHRVAIYCLDWDSTVRAERVDILDANGVVLDTENVTNYHNGQYLAWLMSGHVRIRVTNAARGTNGVISGLFFK